MKNTISFLSDIFRKQILFHIEQLKASIVSRLIKSFKITQVTFVVKSFAQVVTSIVKVFALIITLTQIKITIIEIKKVTSIVIIFAQVVAFVVNKIALIVIFIHKLVFTTLINIVVMKQKIVKIDAIFEKYI